MDVHDTELYDNHTSGVKDFLCCLEGTTLYQDEIMEILHTLPGSTFTSVTVLTLHQMYLATYDDLVWK